MWHVCGTAEPPEPGVRGSPRAGVGKILPRRVRSEGLKQRGRQPIRRGVRGGSPALQGHAERAGFRNDALIAG